MSNKFKPHVLVLPEDDANRQIANGFMLEPSLRQRNLQILPPAGGWAVARDKLKAVHLPELSKYPQRIMVVLVDFDGRPERRQEILGDIQGAVLSRIFVLGVFSEPERLKAALGSYEKIGRELAAGCAANTEDAWGHELLAHNAEEATRLMAIAGLVLF